MAPVRAAAPLAAWALCALAAAAAEVGAAKPEPPLAVSLRLLSADPGRGRYRVEVRLRADTALQDAALIVRVVPREAGRATAVTGPGQGSPSREPLALVPRREQRRQLDVLTGAEQPVLLLVGLDGRVGGARLHRTSALELGPPPAADTRGRLRTDQLGRTYYEIPLQVPPR